MKTKEELNALKEEVNELSSKLARLSDEELKEVVGGNKEFTILPRDQAEFWHSWNPAYPFLEPNKGLD